MRGFRRIVAWFHIGPCPASFASSGLFRVIECSLPMAYAMGFILSPLRGLGALRKANAMLPFPQGAQTIELSNICRFPRRGSARRTGKRPPHYYSLLIWGGGRVTSARRPPRFLLFTLVLASSRPVSGGDYVVWDGNSTPVYGGCQEVIATYCISSN